jgi:photosystem II stability/assembly factor-like uncharacterized protein
MKIFYLSILFIGLFSNLKAQQWERLYGPQEGNVLSIFSFNNRLLAGTSYGTFYSTDNGLSWQKDTFLTGGVVDFKLCGSKLFASAGSGNFGGPGGLFYSQDAINWHRVDSVQAYYPNLFIEGSNIYLSDYSHVYFSGDSGATWQNIGSNLPMGTSTGLVKLNGKLYVTKYPETGNATIYSTDDNGQSWTPHGYDSGWYMGKLGTDGVNLFLATHYGLMISYDEAYTWQSISNTSLPAYSDVSDFIFHNQEIYAATRFGIYHCTMGLFEWSLFGLLGDIVNRVFLNGPDWYAGTSGDGLYRSSDNGNSWQHFTNGIHPASSVHHLASNGNELWAASNGGFEYGLHKSIDSGNTWQRISRLKLRSLVVDGNNIYGGAQYNGLYISYDAGATFIHDSFPSPNPIDELLGSNYALYLYDYNNNRIYQSIDSAQTWTLVPVFGRVMFDNTIIYIAKEDTLFRSADRINWTSCNTPFSFEYFISITRIGNTLLGLTSEGMMKSTDNGVTWTPTGGTFGIPPDCIMAKLFTINNTLCSYAYIPSIDFPSYENIFVSYDEGFTWNEATTPLSEPFNCLLVHNNILFAGVYYSGVYRLNDLATAIEEDTKPFNSSTFSLFPNPSTGQFSLNCPSSMVNGQIKIYNTLGELIQQQIITSSNEQIDLSTRPKGVYFLEMGDVRNKIVLN